MPRDDNDHDFLHSVCLKPFDAITALEFGRVWAIACRNVSVERQLASAVPEKREPVAHQIRLWADRHDISGSDTDIKAAFDDARSL